MVNSLKPLKESSSPPLRTTRPLHDPLHPPSQSPTVLHDTSRSISDLVVGRPPKRQKIAQEPPPPPLARSGPGHGARSSPPRPPTKLSRAEPDGELLQTTNGVRTRLDVNEVELRHDLEHAILAPAKTDAVDQAQQKSSKSQDKRTLRSHNEGSRLKSDLAIYFPNYEDIINDVPKEPELLTADTILHIKYEPRPTVPIPETSPKTTKSQPSSSSKKRQNSLIAISGISTVAQLSPTRKYNGAQVVDFSTIEKSVPHHPQDPLTDAVYFKPHRRAERKEKQLRNIEKERAMHEKLHLERLLDGLQGHDWLRVLGITGVTDSEAKRFEPKRDFFVAEVKALVTKFKEWKEEEKRLKFEKEAAMQAREGDEDDEGEQDNGDSVIHSSIEGPGYGSNTGDLSSSEIDASAARQLQMEASGSAKGKARPRMQPAPAPLTYRPPSPQGPFTSFYNKPHLRAAALGKQRHGRTQTAFGQPIPELEEQEFSLPPDYTTPESLRESARRRRRRKRESLIDSFAKSVR